MITIGRAAGIMGTTEAGIHKWIARGGAVGVSTPLRRLRMPQWQFEPLRWEALPAITTALGACEGWALLSFLESPNGTLQDLTPRQAAEQGQAEQVRAIAEHDGR